MIALLNFLCLIFVKVLNFDKDFAMTKQALDFLSSSEGTKYIVEMGFNPLWEEFFKKQFSGTR